MSSKISSWEMDVVSDHAYATSFFFFCRCHYRCRIPRLNITIWAVALIAHVGCKNFTGLFIVRFILGMCEGSITAGFMIVSSMFYTRTEQTVRVGYWCELPTFAFSSCRGGFPRRPAAYWVWHVGENTLVARLGGFIGLLTPFNLPIADSLGYAPSGF